MNVHLISLLEEFPFISFTKILALPTLPREVCCLSLSFSESVEISFESFLLLELLISHVKLFTSKSLPERFKCTLSFQRCSFLPFELWIMKIVLETFNLRSFINKNLVVLTVSSQAWNEYTFSSFMQNIWLRIPWLFPDLFTDLKQKMVVFYLTTKIVWQTILGVKNAIPPQKKGELNHSKKYLEL